MKIGSTIPALQATRYLERTNAAIARAMQRLASGSRINSARDDAAGLAIATGLDSQLRGLRQSARNINDAFGYLATAEGGIATQTEIAQRMRELAMQAANGIYSDQDRRYLNSEFQSLVEEFDRVAKQTNFNGTNLLDGNFETLSLQVGSSKGDSIDLALESTRGEDLFHKSITTATGTFQVTTETHYADLTQDGLMIADLNGDGHLDYMTTSYVNHATSVKLGNGDGSFQPALTSITGTYDPKAADFNNDGKLDFVVGTNKADVYLGNGNGTFYASAHIAGFETTFGAVLDPLVADFNNDGNMDIYVEDYDGSGMKIALGNGDGTFQTLITASNFNSTNALNTSFIGDVNGDHIVDMVICGSGSGGGASVLIGNGDGTFSNPGLIIGGGGQNQGIVALDDVNDDGKLDIVGTNSGNIYVHLGNGNGTFGVSKTSSSLAGAHVQFVDMDHDGFKDLLSGVNGTGVRIGYGLGDGTFEAPSTFSITLGGRSGGFGAFFKVVDFNEDGFADIIGAISPNSTSVGIADTVTNSVYSPPSIDSQDSSEDALQIIDNALLTLNSRRADIGALQSQLGSAASVTSITIENLSQAKSQILDTDFAEEAAELTKQQILQQAGVSVMAQAQLQMQMVLSLLKNL